MERVEAGLKGRFLRVFFPQRPKVPNLMFHLHSDSPFQIDQRLLSKEEIRQLNDALRRASICSSVNDLSRKFGRDEIEEVVFRRVGRFIDNYVQMQALRGGGYQPTVVASEDSGIYNALVVAEAISLEDALALVREESRALAIAHGTHDKDRFTNPEIPLHTPLMQPHIAEFNHALAKIIINKARVKVVGGNGNTITTPEEIRQEIIRQTTAQNNEKAVRTTLQRLGISKPYEIGLDRTENDNKYLTIGAAALGTAGALAILAVIVHNRHQKTKKV